MNIRKQWSLGVAALVMAAALFIYRGALPREATAPRVSPPAAAAPEPAASFRITFGMTDTAARSWNGRLAPVTGQELSIEPDRLRLHNYKVANEPKFPNDQIREGLEWILSTREAWLRAPEGKVRLQIPSILVHVWKNPSGAPIRVETAAGNFNLDPAAVPLFRPARFLDGGVRVDRVPPVSPADPEERGQQDFPSILSTRGGDLWTAWQENRDDGDAVVARVKASGQWGPGMELAAKTDVFRTSLAEDASGRVWVFWSMQVQDNWDIYARAYDGRQWTPARRLTTAARADLYHRTVTDSERRIWLVWQAFADGADQILARRFDGNNWSDEFRVSEGLAGNNWWPAAAPGPAGSLAVAWDGYAAGNYDVYLRVFKNNRWDPVRPVAATPRFEANPTVAIDQQSRVWIAWHESGPEWGKDFGMLVTRGGTRLYPARSVQVACLEGADLRTTQAPPAQVLDAEDAWDHPHLEIDGTGRPWLLVRHQLMRMPDSRVAGSGTIYGGLWENYATCYEGSGWRDAVYVPRSSGRQESMPATTVDARGEIWLAWSTDSRDTRSNTAHQRAIVLLSHLGNAAAAQPPALRARVEEPAPAAPVTHPAEAEDVRRIRAYRISVGNKSYSIFRGDVHRHTEISWDGGGDGTLLDAYRYARDAAALDFLGVTDHEDEMTKPYAWWLSQKTASFFQLPVFVSFYSYERSLEWPNGHRNILFTRRGIPTLPALSAEVEGYEGAGKLFDHLRRLNGTSISHTSATFAGTDWRDNDPAVEHLVEIYQGMRDTYEYPGAPRPKTLAPSPALTDTSPPYLRYGTAASALAKGYKLGFIASSDHISTHISYACLLAERLTLDSLLEAIRARRAYAATDNIILDVRTSGSGGSCLMGGEITTSTPVRITATIVGTGRLKQIDVIRDNKVVYTNSPERASFELDYTDTDGTPGRRYYYVRVMQTNGEMAWGSPAWVTYGNSRN